MAQRGSNGWMVEVFRLCLVAFGAALGYQVGAYLSDSSPDPVLGAFTAAMIGLVIGAGLGYSLGGVIARTLVKAMDRGDQMLSGVTPEELVAGSTSALIGSLLAAIVGWPLFLIMDAVVAAPLFVLWVVVVGSFAFRIGQRRREAVLGAVSGKAGVRVSKKLAPIRLIDTSVAIDARILDVVKAGFGHGPILVCQPVLDELQQLADATDARRRAKGRRGLATLDTLRSEPGIDLIVIPDEAQEIREVDAKLVRIAKERGVSILTLDGGLTQVALISGVQVQNLHDLALALRPPVQAGDVLELRIVREGKEDGQGVGYLDDGTMVVCEDGARVIGDTIPVKVASVLTNNNGRMLFVERHDQ